MFERLREDIASIFERDPAARTTWEVLSCYPGLHAIYIHKLSRWFWMRGLRWMGRFTSHVGRWLTGIEIHPGASLGRRVFIDHGMGVVIGETSVVGDDTTLYHGVTLGGTTWNKGKRHPTLGKGVVVGAGAKILGPIMLGDEARIGSNAVVVKDVPEGATVVGVPGRMLEDRTMHHERFEAYAVVQSQDDPYAKAIQELMHHSSELQQAIDALNRKVEELESQRTDGGDHSDGAQSGLRAVR